MIESAENLILEHGRIDAVEQRLDRIEKRLDPASA
jgi:tetrahydromethanopterin S-methyltransferase subunit G